MLFFLQKQISWELIMETTAVVKNLVDTARGLVTDPAVITDVTYGSSFGTSLGAQQLNQGAAGSIVLAASLANMIFKYPDWKIMAFGVAMQPVSQVAINQGMNSSDPTIAQCSKSFAKILNPMAYLCNAVTLVAMYRMGQTRFVGITLFACAVKWVHSYNWMGNGRVKTVYEKVFVEGWFTQCGEMVLSIGSMKVVNLFFLAVRAVYEIGGPFTVVPKREVDLKAGGSLSYEDMCTLFTMPKTHEVRFVASSIPQSFSSLTQFRLDVDYSGLLLNFFNNNRDALAEHLKDNEKFKEGAEKDYSGQSAGAACCGMFAAMLKDIGERRLGSNVDYITLEHKLCEIAVNLETMNNAAAVAAFHDLLNANSPNDIVNAIYSLHSDLNPERRIVLPVLTPMQMVKARIYDQLAVYRQEVYNQETEETQIPFLVAQDLLGLPQKEKSDLQNRFYLHMGCRLLGFVSSIPPFRSQGPLLNARDDFLKEHAYTPDGVGSRLGSDLLPMLGAEKAYVNTWLLDWANRIPDAATKERTLRELEEGYITVFDKNHRSKRIYVENYPQTLMLAMLCDFNICEIAEKNVESDESDQG